MVNIAINGFGRIGRNVLRALYESGRNNEFNVVAINDIAKPEGIAHLLKYDTAHGRFRFNVALENNTLNVAGDDIALLAISDIKDLPWKDLGVDIVLEFIVKNFIYVFSKRFRLLYVDVINDDRPCFLKCRDGFFKYFINPFMEIGR